MDTAYRTRGHKFQSLIGLKIVWNGSDVSEYITKNSVIRLEFRAKELFWKKLRIKLVPKNYIFVLLISGLR